MPGGFLVSGAQMVESQRVVVGDTPTALNAALRADNIYGHAVVIRPKAAGIDIGGSGVTSGGGFAVAADETVSVDLDDGEVLYGIAAATTTVTVHVLRRGV